VTNPRFAPPPAPSPDPAQSFVHAVTIDGSNHGPYVGESSSQTLGGYEKIRFDRETVQQILQDLTADAGELHGTLQGNQLRFTWSAGHDGIGGEETALPGPDGLYPVGGLWAWEAWRPSRARDAAESAPAVAQEPPMIPVHLAGPGDAVSMIRSFADSHGTWGLWAPTLGTAYVTIRECMTVLAEVDLERVWAGASNLTGWTVVGCHSPVHPADWRAEFTANTPCELVQDFLEAIEDDCEYPDTEPIADIATMAADMGWSRSSGFNSWRSPDGSLRVRIRDDRIDLAGGPQKDTWKADLWGPIPAAILEAAFLSATGRLVQREAAADNTNAPQTDGPRPAAARLVATALRAPAASSAATAQSAAVHPNHRGSGYHVADPHQARR